MQHQIGNVEFAFDESYMNKTSIYKLVQCLQEGHKDVEDATLDALAYQQSIGT